MKRELFKFIEGIPATAGYANYECFQEGTIVYLEEDFPWKYCIACDEEGITLLDEEGNEILLDWHASDSDYPIWEDKLEPYKDVDMELEDTPQNVTIVSIPKKQLLSIMQHLPDNTIICLDINGSLTKKYIKEYGSDHVGLLLKQDDVNVIAVFPSQKEIKIPDINDLFDTLEDIDHLTINFHGNNK